MNVHKCITLKTALPKMVNFSILRNHPLVSFLLASIGRPTTIKSGQPMKTRVFVTLKNGVLDPQGKAIHHALEGLGFEGVNDVRAGRLIEIDHEPGVSRSDLEAMCTKLLANMVIENFEIEQA